MKKMIDKIKNCKFFVQNNKANYHSYDPKNDIDLQPYENDLKKIFNNKESMNSALFGAHGSGKRSIVASYKNKHPNIKFLHLSLAHYEAQTETDNSQIESSILERKIINQLIHQIKFKSVLLTGSKIKREEKFDIPITIFLIVAIILIFLAMLHIYHFATWNDYIETVAESFSEGMETILLRTISPRSRLISGAIALFCTFVILLFVALKFKSRNRIKSIKLHGSGVEFQENDDPYFDKCFDQMLYLFEKAAADVIVFEDINQHTTNRILQLLADINKHINMSSRRNNSLRFLYLMPDDLLNHSRINFFNFSFSVVGYNIHDRFIDYLEYCKILDLFDTEGVDKEFLEKISQCLVDMNLLKAICNSFLASHNRINVESQTYLRLLAIIVCKLRFPKEYNNLRSKRGFIYSLLSQKESYIDKKITKLAVEKQRITDEHLESKTELDIVYEYKIEQYKKDDNLVGDYDVAIKKLLTEKSDREVRIETQGKKRVESIEKELQILQQQKKSLQTVSAQRSLKKLFFHEDIEEIFKHYYTDAVKEITDFDINDELRCELMKFLIVNGYINEDYQSYIRCCH